MIEKFADIHTHRPDAGPDSVINLEPGMDMLAGRYYSVGVHPWNSGDADVDGRWAWTQSLAADPQVVMIGECGLDRKHGAAMDVQMELLLRHIRLSESVGKPLLLHVVGAFPEIIRLRRESSPRQPWIVHGFRGKPQLAAELLRHGFSLSLGQRFNPAAARIIPQDRLFTETDTSPLDIADIRRSVSDSRCFE